MKVYALRNDNGEYISISGGRTKDWFEASKFSEDKIKSRLEYINPEFKLVAFEVEEVKEVEVKEENTKEKLINFLEQAEEEIEFDSEVASAEEIGILLEELGFELIEEQHSDGVEYSNFYSEGMGEIVMRHRTGNNKIKVEKA